MCIRDRNRQAPLNNKEVIVEADLWEKKIKEILSFQTKNVRDKISKEQRQELVRIYNRYRSVFSDSPGKAKNFVCELKFLNPVHFNKNLTRQPNH